MYGNAMALAEMNKMSGDAGNAEKYSKEAGELKKLIETKLWNAKDGFFETLKNDTAAGVREAIGFIPWYFNMPDNAKYDVAWKQVTDEKGFSAPYGLTTCEPVAALPHPRRGHV